MSCSSSSPFPEALLALVSALPKNDREVFFYLITFSLFPKASKPAPDHGVGCGCLECYMGYWDRWNSSPNSQAIHQAMDMFESHFATTDSKVTKARERKLHARRIMEWLSLNCENNNTKDKNGEKLEDYKAKDNENDVLVTMEKNYLWRIVPYILGFLASNFTRSVSGPVSACSIRL